MHTYFEAYWCLLNVPPALRGYGEAFIKSFQTIIYGILWYDLNWYDHNEKLQTEK